MVDPVSQITSRSGQLRRLSSVYDLPENALRLSDTTVLSMQWKIIENWKPRREMWPFTHNPSILATFGSVGGVIIMSHFRKKFDLRGFSRIPSYIPMVALPAFMSAMTHNFIISNRVLLGRFDCPLCAQLRAGLMQAGTGAFYPLLMAPPIAIVIARKHWTYPVPKISQPREVFNMLLVTSYPLKYAFASLLAVQFLIGFAITKHELRVFHEKLVTGILPAEDRNSEPEMN